jgi:hypothetical protein
MDPPRTPKQKKQPWKSLSEQGRVNLLRKWSKRKLPKEAWPLTRRPHLKGTRSESPKRKRKTTAEQRDPLSGWRRKERGSAAWAFCFLTPVRGSFSLLTTAGSYGAMEAKATLCFSRVGTARRFCQVHVRAGIVRSPASAGFTRFWSLANGPCCYGTTCCAVSTPGRKLETPSSLSERRRLFCCSCTKTAWRWRGRLAICHRQDNAGA